MCLYRCAIAITFFHLFSVFSYCTFSRATQELQAPPESSLLSLTEDAFDGLISLRAYHAHRPLQKSMPSVPPSPDLAPASFVDKDSRPAEWEVLDPHGSLLERFDVGMERSTVSVYLELNLKQWLAARLSFITAMLITTFALLVVCMPELNKAAYSEFHSDDDNIDSANNESGKSLWGLQLDTTLVALALACSLSLPPVLRSTVHYCMDCESNVVAFKRLNELAHLAPEGQAVNTRLRGAVATNGSGDAAFGRQTQWLQGVLVGARASPRLGSVKFEHVVARYRTNLPPVLRGVSFTALPGSLVGIVGGAKSGKSTLCNVIVRLLEADSDGWVIRNKQIAN